MTNVFHDWEFYENGSTIEPISVGLVNDEGQKFYAVFEEGYERASKSQWLIDNVRKHLNQKDIIPTPELKKSILEFVKSSSEQPELWAWYGAYDHVALAQTLGGPMINMPAAVPWYTNDIKTLQWLAKSSGPESRVQSPPKQDPHTEHHALYDAEHDMQLFYYYLLRA